MLLWASPRSGSPDEKNLVRQLGLIFAATLIILLVTFQANGAEAMLKTGDVAPEFSLLSDKGDTVTLAGFRGSKNVVLIFYPGDATPGCTKQLCAIRDDYAAFEKKNAVVFGVNPGSMESHRKFAERKKYQFPLLVDQDKAVAERYGVKGIFVVRTVFVIGKDGKVVYVKKGMPSNEEILSAIPE